MSVEEGGDGRWRGAGRMVPTLRSPSSGRRSWGSGQGDGAGAVRGRPRPGGRRGRSGVGSSSGSLKTSSKRSLTKARIEGTVRKLVVRAQDLPAARLDEALRLLVDRDVGAAEAVDGLLGVADDEELAGLRGGTPRQSGRGLGLPGPRPGGTRSRPAAGRCPGTRPRGWSRSASGSSGAPGAVAGRTSRARRRRSWKSTTAAFAFASS